MPKVCRVIPDHHFVNDGWCKVVLREKKKENKIRDL